MGRSRHPFGTKFAEETCDTVNEVNNPTSIFPHPWCAELGANAAKTWALLPTHSDCPAVTVGLLTDEIQLENLGTSGVKDGAARGKFILFFP